MFGAFVRELYLQRLSSNVRMVLASARPDDPIEELAQIADKIVEVATPLVSAVTTTPPHITLKWSSSAVVIVVNHPLMRGLSKYLISPLKQESWLGWQSGLALREPSA